MTQQLTTCFVVDRCANRTRDDSAPVAWRTNEGCGMCRVERMDKEQGRADRPNTCVHYTDVARICLCEYSVHGVTLDHTCSENSSWALQKRAASCREGPCATRMIAWILFTPFEHKGLTRNSFLSSACHRIRIRPKATPSTRMMLKRLMSASIL